MTHNITINNAAPFTIKITLISRDEKIQYSIPGDGQVNHEFSTEEGEPYHFRAQAQQVGGTMVTAQEEITTATDISLQVLLGNTGIGLYIRAEALEENEF